MMKGKRSSSLQTRSLLFSPLLSSTKTKTKTSERVATTMCVTLLQTFFWQREKVIVSRLSRLWRTFWSIQYSSLLFFVFFLLQWPLDPKRVHLHPKEATTTAPTAELNLPMAITWVIRMSYLTVLLVFFFLGINLNKNNCHSKCWFLFCIHHISCLFLMGWGQQKAPRHFL